jgi:hypothetical protein
VIAPRAHLHPGDPAQAHDRADVSAFDLQAIVGTPARLNAVGLAGAAIVESAGPALSAPHSPLSLLKSGKISPSRTWRGPGGLEALAELCRRAGCGYVGTGCFPGVPLADDQRRLGAQGTAIIGAGHTSLVVGVAPW